VVDKLAQQVVKKWSRAKVATENTYLARR